jgi:peptidoglycan/LPS O-acetylase OafA/YrhL
VAFVVIFHAALLSGAALQLPGGFVGVDLFFVVSGFLITGLLLREHERNGTISFSRFYARRVRRILPAAAITLLITLPAAYLLVSVLARPDAMADGAAAALSIANVRFTMTTDYFNPVSYSPFLHFWSLGVEEQFYLVWPLLFLAAAWRGSVRRIALVLIGVIGVSLMANIVFTASNPSFAFYMLPTRAWQLAAGGLLAVALGSRRPLPATMARFGHLSAPLIGWSAAAALLGAALLFDSNTTYPGVAAIVPTIAGVALIATGSARFGPGLLLRREPLRFLGKISYSLYLWHWPILILGALALNADAASAGSANGALVLLSPGQAAALALLSIPVATASWALVEEPFRHGRIPLPRPSRLVAVGVTAMMIIAITGAGLDLDAQSTLAGLSDSSTPSDAPAPIAAAPSITGVSPSLTSSPTPSPSDESTFAPPPTPSPTPAFTPVLPMPVDSPPDSYGVRGLLPSVASAPGDFELPWKQGCLGRTNDATPPAWGTCVYGDPNGTYTVALIGDSHASAFFPAVNALAKAHGWKLVVYLKVDCKFVDMPIYNDLLKREYTECATWNKRSLAIMTAHPPDLTIVLMNRYIESIRSADSGPTAQGHAIAREIEKLPRSAQTVLIDDWLYPWNLNIPSCLSNHSDWRNCDYSRSTGLNDSWGVREAVAAADAHIPLIDSTSWVCPGTSKCPPVIGGMIVFRDEHHLTATYSASLAPALDAALSNIFNTGAATTPSPSPTPTEVPPYD